ncbi:DUF7010 family protein [Spirosoma montaniterrae]|uniref:Uncharacterized protein n=1 Tax=Spirosoma montaniterrae TaxID=1178516 RepID=A0A1P9WWZ1_9BACT|nr:hypothetical protein [Spirosoma montaniterrae]AQG79905.1 hypothetical protein AWR27_11560 [Spirosoma montaniterrae]
MTTPALSQPPDPKAPETIEQAQRDMRLSYAAGAVGIFVSGTVWLVAALVNLYVSPQQAIWTLLIGGALIHPLSLLVYKVLGMNQQHHPQNPLAKLAMEGTVWMLMCIPLAYVLSFQRTEWFFQGMLLIIGGRYLTFATLYGMRLYWLLGAVLGIAANVLFVLQANAFVSALAGSLTEICFGFVIYRRR